jgi:selenocysteine lyase/cysteine desulfurase
MNLSEIRALFPHLQTGQVYFNHAAIGPWSKPALDRIDEYAGQRSGALVENYPFFVKWNTSAKEKLGKILNADPERIAWVDNVSNGLNILAQGIGLKSGDRVILNNIEFPSNIYPFLNLQKSGVEIDFVKADYGIVDIAEIEKLITPKTRLISISLVQFLSGYRADIKAIGELCRSKGIIFCVDAIQAAGAVEIDVIESKVDFLSGGTQKWLMSSQGLSYIYITEELQTRIDQKSVGWTSVENSWNLLDYDLTLRKTADRFQSGTVNALGVAIFDAVLDVFLGFGMKNVEQNVLSNSRYLISSISELGVNPVLKSTSDANLAGIVSFKHNKAKEIKR